MKTIVLSGASRGIGLELCRLAQEQGLRVIALSRNIRPLEKLDLVSFSVDLSNPDSLQPYIDYLQQENQTIDYLVNNAGALQNIPFSETTWEVFQSDRKSVV